jgi:hypothetical protein
VSAPQLGGNDATWLMEPVIIQPLLSVLNPVLRRDAQSLLEATYDLEGELTNILLQPLNDDLSTALYTMASTGKTEESVGGADQAVRARSLVYRTDRLF